MESRLIDFRIYDCIVKLIDFDNRCNRCERISNETLHIKNEKICFKCIKPSDLRKKGYWFERIFIMDKKGNIKKRYY